MADTKTILMRLKLLLEGGEQAQKNIGGVVKSLGKVALGVAGVAALGVAFKTSYENIMLVEKGLQNISTLLGEQAGKIIPQYRAGLGELSRKFGIATTEMTTPLYNIVSRGVEAGRAMEVLEKSARLSVSGVATLGESVDATTTLLNAYKLSLEDVDRIQDILQVATRDGATTVGEMGQSLFQAAPLASALGISIEQVAGSVVTLTKQGVPTAVAMTNIRAAMAELSRENMKAAKEFKRITGQSFPDFIKGGGTLQEALALMGETAEKEGKSINNYFRGIEAGQMALMMSGKNARYAQADFEKFANSAGEVQRAFENAQQSPAFKMEIAKRNISSAISAIVRIFIPLAVAITQAIGWVANFVRYLANLPAGIKLVIAGIVAFAVVTKTALIPSLLAWIKTTYVAVAANTALTASFPPLLIAVAVIGAVIAAYELLKDKTIEKTKATIESIEKEKEHKKELIDSKQKGQALAEQYIELAKKQNRTQAETEKMNRLYKEVGKSYPKLVSGTKDWSERLKEMNTVVGKGKGEIEKLKSEMEALNKALAQQKLLLATEEAEKMGKGYVGVFGEIGNAIQTFFTGTETQANQFESTVQGLIENANKALLAGKEPAYEMSALVGLLEEKQRALAIASEEGNKEMVVTYTKQTSYLRNIIEKLKEGKAQVEELKGEGIKPDELLKEGGEDEEEERNEALNRRLRLRQGYLELEADALKKQYEDERLSWEEQLIAFENYWIKRAEIEKIASQLSEETSEELTLRLKKLEQEKSFDAEKRLLDREKKESDSAKRRAERYFALEQEYRRLDADALKRAMNSEKLSDEERLKAKELYFQKRVEIIEAESAREIELAKENAKEIELIEAEKALKLKELGIEQLDWEKDLAEQKIELAQQERNEKIKLYQDYVNKTLELASAITDLLGARVEQRKQREIKAIEASGLSEEQKQKRIDAINKKYAKEEEKIAKQKKRIRIATAIAETAMAVIEALPDLIKAGLVGAIGAVQIATIAAQPYYWGGRLKKGQVGFFEGKRDELIIPERGAGSFVEIARKELFPELYRKAITGKTTIESGIINNWNFNGPVLDTDADAVREWKRRGAMKTAEQIEKRNKSIGKY